MTLLHLRSKAGPDGIVHIDTGIPGADVEVVLTVSPVISDEEWKREVAEILDPMVDVHLETYPRDPVRDPWGEE